MGTWNLVHRLSLLVVVMVVLMVVVVVVILLLLLMQRNEYPKDLSVGFELNSYRTMSLCDAVETMQPTKVAASASSSALTLTKQKKEWIDWWKKNPSLYLVANEARDVISFFDLCYCCY